LTTLEIARLPEPVRRQLPTLCEGHFIAQGHNVLAFGLPGRGKRPMGSNGTVKSVKVKEVRLRRADISC
jgi:hypothetical protein